MPPQPQAPAVAGATRKLFTFALGGWAAATALGANLSPERPNVLFIASDDLRTELGCYGDPIVRSPNIDGLARRGVVFDRAYCQQAVCSPSRTSLLTGRRPDSIQVWDLATYFRTKFPDVVTLPQYLKSQGYFTQDIGKIFHNDTRPASAGARLYDLPSWSVPPSHADGEHWRDWVVPGQPGGPAKKAGPTQSIEAPDEAYYDGQIANEAVDALRRFHDSAQPFFLAVGFWKPHLPFNAPKKYWDLYKADEIPKSPNPRPPAGAPAIALHDSFELRNYAGVAKSGDISDAETAELRRGYYACISFMDTQLGKVLDELKRLGMDQNTVIVLWGDNGFHLGDHNLWGKTTNYELDTHVPLIIADPRQPTRGVHSGSLVELLDLYPTLVELCHLPQPPGLEGKTLVPVLRIPTLKVHEAVLSQHPHPFYTPHATHMGYTLRTERYRYVEWRDLVSRAVTARELYDYDSDPWETRNLMATPGFDPKLVDNLANELRTLRGPTARDPSLN